MAILIDMFEEQTTEEILELMAEAAAARRLAATFKDGPTVSDLLKYAAELDSWCTARFKFAIA